MMTPLCYIKTPFPQKFGVPRQPLLAPAAWGALTFPKNDFFSEAFRGIEQFSHLWLIFEFHQIPEGAFNGLVRPPRFENKKKLGVYATRSPHRPNRLGLSVVQFERLEITDSEVVLWVQGVDLVDGTPIYDIKPYLPYVDQVPGARATDFPLAPTPLPVSWLIPPPPEQQRLIEQVLALDPRPAQDKSCQDEYAMSLAGYNIRFRFTGHGFEVLALE
jgi:tRNA (adenine37-N6)-methyltransferase